ncbi:MAG: YgaP family membrane protein [Guyparkeria sp.]
MTANVGMIDKWLRIVVGVLLIALALFDVIGWWGYIGIIPLATGVINFCPVYKLLGMDTLGGGSGKSGNGPA